MSQNTSAQEVRQARQLDTLFELRLRRARRAMQSARREYQAASELVHENQRVVKNLRTEMESLIGLPANVVEPALITHLHDRQLRTRWLRHDLHGAMERLNSSLASLSEKRNALAETQRLWGQLKQRRECLDQARRDALMDSQVHTMALDELQVAEQVCASTSNNREGIV